MTTNTSQVFNWKSPHFTLGLITLVLGVFAVLGVNFPQAPSDVAGQIVTTISQSGYYAVLGVLAVSVLGPIILFVQKGGFKNIKAADFFGSPAFWVYLVGFLVSIAVIIGIDIPSDTAEQAVAFVFAKDWTALGTLILVNIVSPLIRFIRSQRAVEPGN